jgi:F-type H+-transporting ATPase subunit b
MISIATRSLAAAIVALGLTAPALAAAEAEAEHGHTHIGGPQTPGQQRAAEDPTEVSLDLATFTFVVFLLVLAILWKFAWGPISEALERREHSIAEHIAAAERSHEEAKQLLAQHEAKLAGAAAEVRELIEEARRDAEVTRQQILAEAKAGADAERQRAVRDIESATDSALKSLAERSATLAVELAGKIVQTKLSSDEHNRLIQEALAKFPQGEPARN